VTANEFGRRFLVQTPCGLMCGTSGAVVQMLRVGPLGSLMSTTTQVNSAFYPSLRAAGLADAVDVLRQYTERIVTPRRQGYALIVTISR